MGIYNQTSHTLPSTPIHHHSSSSSDFEFTSSLSLPNSASANLRPADELFYNGQLLPLHLSPRNSMVRTLFTSTTTTSHSSDHHSFISSSSSRPSSVSEDGDRLPHKMSHSNSQAPNIPNQKKVLSKKQFSFNKFSSVFRKETKPASATTTADLATVSLKEKIRKYMKKLSKAYSQKTNPPMVKRDDIITYSFSGNIKFLTRTSCVSSCPSTMPSSPYHSGVLCKKGVVNSDTNRSSSSSSTEELQSAIQGAIAHCKNSLKTQ